ncbi:hypothetical protein AB0P28_00400 [Pseudarthrobacter sp. NPDC089323]
MIDMLEQPAVVGCTLDHVNEALFNFGERQTPAVPTSAEPPVQDHQIAAIRQAFAAAGIDSQERRQEIAQSCVVRPLTALRELSAVEAHRVLQRLKAIAAAKPRQEGASAWDLREEDTWIDKL